MVDCNPGFYSKLEKAKRYIVMRYPCLMEDEGRHEFIAIFDTKAKAKKWIASQKNEYFKPSDYYIAASE